MSGPPARARRLAIALLLVPAACGRPTPVPATSGAAAAQAMQCRIGPDGAPVAVDEAVPGERVAERGIGGTGGFAAPVPAGARTGAPAPAAPVPPVSNGIGGTGFAAAKPPPSLGVVGIITGFGSVCLAGYEIGISSIAAIADDGRAASPGTLRAGQLAVLAAGSTAHGFEADALGIRHEVVGPIETLASDRLVVVAGQSVTPASRAYVARDLAPGDWVAVSGLRAPDGSIVATRIDPAPVGPVFLRGRLSRDRDGRLAIGPTHLIGADTMLAAGTPVALSGAYAANGIRVVSIARDVLAADPGAYFPRTVSRVAIERFVPAPTGGPAHDIVTLGRSGSGAFGTIGLAPAPFASGFAGFLPGVAGAPTSAAPRAFGGATGMPSFGPAPTSGAATPNARGSRYAPVGGGQPSGGPFGSTAPGAPGPGPRGPPPH